jgi:hypothetical protein
MVPRKFLIGLLLTGLLLPVAVVILLGLTKLLAALGDHSGAACVSRVVLGVSVVWCIDLTFLLLALGANSIDRTE